MTDTDAQLSTGLPSGTPLNEPLPSAHVSTIVSGGQIQDVVTIGTAGGVNFSAPAVTVNIYDASQLAASKVQRLPDTGPLELAAFEPETVQITAGQFVMGSDGGDDVYSYETPRYAVDLPAYRIGRSPVTNAQYLEFVRRTRSLVPTEMGWQLAAVGQLPPPGTSDHPVVGISWDEAVAYCRWLSDKTRRPYRLASEAEWEKAARGTDGRRYPWGDDFAMQCCNSLESGVGATTAVGAYGLRGASVYGCNDMAGNVWEWTSTIWGPERGQPEFWPPYVLGDGRDRLEWSAPFRELRICRGGSFREPADRVTCTARGRQAADARDSRRGFRVALTI